MIRIIFACSTTVITDSGAYAANYPTWDFSTVWLPPQAGGYPMLR